MLVKSLSIFYTLYLCTKLNNYTYLKKESIDSINLSCSCKLLFACLTDLCKSLL